MSRVYSIYAEIHYLRIFHSYCTAKMLIDSAVQLFLLYLTVRQYYDVTKRYMSWNAKSMTSYSVDASSGYIDQCGMTDRFSAVYEEELLILYWRTQTFSSPTQQNIIPRHVTNKCVYIMEK